MTKKVSAGLLLFRRNKNDIQVFLVHPGGPLWMHKDDGAWSIPKGEYGEGDDPLEAAKREFFEETGFQVTGSCHALSPLKQPGGKVVSAWAVEGEFDAARVKSNSFSLEWPPHSGKMQEFPEIDRGDWFDLPTAKRKLHQAQRDFLNQLQQLVMDPPAE